MAVQSTERSMTATMSDNGPTDRDSEPAGLDIRATAADARDAAASAAARVPEVVEATRGALEGAIRQMDAGSDEALRAGASLALGVAIGMLVGSAPRIFVAASLVPVVAIGAILLDRQTRGQVGSRSATKA
jgi:hypothetical protein